MEHNINKLQIDMAELKTDIGYIKASLEKNDSAHEEILKRIDDYVSLADRKYVNVDSFAPVQKIVYGMVGAVLLTSLYALLNLVIQ